jgi:pimeloyl-ACP methyl ester carboxylesterase
MDLMRRTIFRPIRHLGLVLLLAVSTVAAEPQVTGLEVFHRSGQTFITWKEVDPPRIASDIDDAAIRKMVRDLDEKKLHYRIYRSSNRIDSVEGLTPIAKIKPLSCWNIDYYGVEPKKGEPALRYVIEDGAEPLPPGTGLYVHNPALPGSPVSAKSYYAVTVVKNGTENKGLTEANRTSAPVEETAGLGTPVLQRIVKPDSFNYIDKPELHYYVRWESPPNSSVENRPMDYVVAIPPSIEARPTPVGLHLHCWGGSLDGGYGWWYSYQKPGTTYLIASNQVPYDWWTGYHELYYSGPRDEQKWKQGIVRPYSTARMLSFLDWAAKKYDLDLNRVFTAGSSMGGSGAPMFAIRYPDRIAWSIGWVGVHDPGNTPQFTGSYEQVYGDKSWGVKFDDGTPVFEYYKDAAFLRKYPQKEIGFITWSNGKNDSGIGWPQAVEFYQAMQQTRRPHIFVWGLSGHGQRASMPADAGERIMPIDIHLDCSLPAFTNCSLDDDPGTAAMLKEPKEVTIGREKNRDIYDGDPTGQVNLYLYWRSEDIVDTPDRWEMTVGLTDTAPKGQCTVDITPRRLQSLKILPNQTYKWNNTCEGKVIQNGNVTADKYGLLTIRGALVNKKTNRITIFQRGTEAESQD